MWPGLSRSPGPGDGSALCAGSGGRGQAPEGGFFGSQSPSAAPRGCGQGWEHRRLSLLDLANQPKFPSVVNQSIDGQQCHGRLGPALAVACEHPASAPCNTPSPHGETEVRGEILGCIRARVCASVCVHVCAHTWEPPWSPAPTAPPGLGTVAFAALLKSKTVSRKTAVGAALWPETQHSARD